MRPVQKIAVVVEKISLAREDCGMARRVFRRVVLLGYGVIVSRRDSVQRSAISVQPLGKDKAKTALQ